MLEEWEWNEINNILLELYMQEDIVTLSNRLLQMLHLIILYTKGYFILLDDRRKIIREKSYFAGMEEEAVNEYINHYFYKDYLHYMYETTVSTVVYKDSEMLDDKERKEYNFYKDFMEAMNVPYGCGILIIKDGKPIGILNLFKSSELGDFFKKDIYILNILKNHIENIICKLLKEENKNLLEVDFRDKVEKFGITKREYEIVKLLLKGFSNTQICDELQVSLSTVKTHIYNIYAKLGVKSRTQLINLMVGK
jgi:DNA-binding CsgD family transcriptional regulator